CDVRLRSNSMTLSLHDALPILLEADFIEQIRAKVSSVWRYPPSVRPDQEVSVRIQLVPTGEVIQVQVVSSSGHAALDRSVEQARSEEHTSELQSRENLVCRLLL